MKYEQLLQQAGLTNGETKVYIALLKIGESTVGPISEAANVSLSKIYEILHNLVRKGLVGHIIKNNTKHFSATDPERIIDYLERKKKEIDNCEKDVIKILPDLRSQRLTNTKKTQATMIEGMPGIRNFHNLILDNAQKGDEILVMGIPKETAQKNDGFFLEWHERRAKKGVKVKLIYNEDCKELGEKRKKIILTEVRYLPKNIVAPTWTLVTKDIVATAHMTDNPVLVLIENEGIAKGYVTFFHLFWKLAKK